MLSKNMVFNIFIDASYVKIFIISRSSWIFAPSLASLVILK